MLMKKIIIGIIFAFFLFGLNYQPIFAAPTISGVATLTSTTVEKYAKFEIKLDVLTVATNYYYPYDSTSHNSSSANPWIPSWQNAGINGISVDMLLSQNNFATTKVLPCFYYQPYEQVGANDDSNVALLPVGKPEWRCRFAPEQTGNYQYKIRAIDSGGFSESETFQFLGVDPGQNSPTKHGFVRVSQTDKRFFEFSDGTPFVWPLVSTNLGYDIATIRSRVQKLGVNGIHFIRWFPTDEDGIVNPFAGDIKGKWANGITWWKTDYVDTEKGNRFSFFPYYWTNQQVILKPGAKYKFTFRANLDGNPEAQHERAIKTEIQGSDGSIINGSVKYLCAQNNTLFSKCQSKLSGWQTYEIKFTNSTNQSQVIFWIHGLFQTNDAPSVSTEPDFEPYNEIRTGLIRISSLTLQRDESTISGVESWGTNLFAKGDTDTYRYVDQIEAAKIDEILTQAAKYGVYQKWTMFEKNDGILNAFRADGTVVNNVEWNANVPKYFFSDTGQVSRWLEEAYERYFIARWSYSTAIHSLEIANEIGFDSWSINGALAMAHYFKTNSLRHLLVTTSFFGYWADKFFYDNADIDYGDKHWYAVRNSANCYTNPESCEPNSNLWSDSAENVRFCSNKFYDYFIWYGGLNKPIVRGETGFGVSGVVGEQDSVVASETTGTWYHKQLWAHVGLLGFTCGGEWWPRLWETPVSGQFPNSTYDTFKIYKAYEAYISSETSLNNGTHVAIGTDNLSLTDSNAICSSGNNCIMAADSPPNTNLRAFGSKDPVTRRALVWVDNKNNTWANNPGGAPTQTANFTIFGMPQGEYTQEIWDTRTGTFTISSTKITVLATGTDANKLKFIASGITTDKAYKFYVACGFPGDIDCSGQVNALDLSKLILKFGQSNVITGEDVDGSGQVNAIDLAILLSNFGK
jgi:hypothetical protein